VQVGLATLQPGGGLVKHPANPILKTAPTGWDSGTVGRRSRILKEGAFYYMAYEGSTDAPFDKAQWSTGLARSVDLVAWEKAPANPVIPVKNGFGNDGPELVAWNGQLILYVRGDANGTDRYVLTSP